MLKLTRIAREISELFFLRLVLRCMRRLLLLAFASSLSLIFTGCMGMYLRDNSYEATTKPVEINGAEVKIAVKPMGGDMYGSFSAMLVGFGAGKTDGPFIWRVEGSGNEDEHLYLWVNSIKVETSLTKRSEPYDKKLLNFKSEFKPMKGKENKGKSFANHQIYGELLVYPKKDGDIKITANVSVKNKVGKIESKTIVFQLKANSSNEFESVFLPTEIINSFGKKDPTEWNW